MLTSYTFSSGSRRELRRFLQWPLAPPAGALLNFTLMDPHLPSASSLQASAEVGAGDRLARMSLAISYQHVHGMHLVASINRNINADGTRPNPAFGNAKQYTGAADSQYDGLAIVALCKDRLPWGSACACLTHGQRRSTM